MEKFLGFCQAGLGCVENSWKGVLIQPNSNISSRPNSFSSGLVENWTITIISLSDENVSAHMNQLRSLQRDALLPEMMTDCISHFLNAFCVHRFQSAARRCEYKSHIQQRLSLSCTSRPVFIMQNTIWLPLNESSSYFVKITAKSRSRATTVSALPLIKIFTFIQSAHNTNTSRGRIRTESWFRLHQTEEPPEPGLFQSPPCRLKPDPPTQTRKLKHPLFLLQLWLLETIGSGIKAFNHKNRVCTDLQCNGSDLI